MSEVIEPLTQQRLARAFRQPAVMVLAARRPQAIVYRLRIRAHMSAARRAAQEWCLFVCRFRGRHSAALLTVRWWLLGSQP